MSQGRTEQDAARLRDALTGAPAAEVVRFGIDGAIYEVPLSQSNATRLRRYLHEFTAVATPVRTSSGAPIRRAEGRDEIARWARTKGYRVGDRGPLPQRVVNAYHEAHDNT